MPNFCIFNNQLIKPEHIYKFNIDKKSKFTCYTCDQPLQFRQCRNANKNYTEHFYHQNNKKNTHIACEKNTYENVNKHMSRFHSEFSKYIIPNSREVVRINNSKKHIVDGYDETNSLGIEFQNSKITLEEVLSRELTTELDWIFNVEEQFIRKIKIGNYIVCEIPHNNWENIVQNIKNNVFLYTGFSEWIWLSNREYYRVEITNKLYNVWIGDICSFQDVLENTCLQDIITDEGRKHYSNFTNKLPEIDIIYARCKKSMYFLDRKHRNYINNYKFNCKKTIAIKSVAGSGKTTTLLKLAKNNNDKKILYIAFNKSLITEIKDKIVSKKIKNLEPYTFDALLFKLYRNRYKKNPELIDLRPQFISTIIPWFKNKPYKLRKYYCDQFIHFCNDVKNDDIIKYCVTKLGNKKPLLETMWKNVLQKKLITFETIRKQAYINRWFKDYIDNNFDIIMIDESQDFDKIMLNMLLNDTTIPKLFVGDPKQSIYEFRGCINAFNYLPDTTLLVEFYSTFRMGNPACEEIRNKFNDCWMISKSKHNTIFVETFDKDEKYIYLFRSWRELLLTGEKLQKIWIYNYDKQIIKIKNLYNKLNKIDLNDEDNNFEDDLPKFLKSLSLTRLEELINNITKNIVNEKDSIIKLYTVHSYKGMEENNIRLAHDIDIIEDENIYYVAITRGLKKICCDI